MLLRICCLLVVAAVLVRGEPAPLEQNLIGRWRGQSEREIVLRSDHTFVARNGSQLVSGSWRLETARINRDARPRLITLTTVLPNGKQRFYKSTFEITGDRLTFTTHAAVTVSRGEPVADPRIDFTPTVYQRVR